MISVCMATYNGERYLRGQVETILAQLGQDDELVVSDDGSCDSTLAILDSLNDPRVKVYLNPGARGFTPNFENALKHAEGDIIFLSDQDDLWQPCKLKLMSEKLLECDFVISDCVTIDDNFGVLSSSRFQQFNVKRGLLRHFVKSRYLGCCMAFKRCVLEKALPFPPKYEFVEHDIWLAAIGEAFFSLELLDSPLLIYRRHGANASDGGFGNGDPLLRKIARRIYRASELISASKRDGSGD